MLKDTRESLSLDIALTDLGLTAGAPSAHDAALSVAPDFVPMEKNLASLGFFSANSKINKTPKAKTIQFTRLVDGRKVQASVSIAPSVLSALPTTADQDKYLAFQKILLDRRKKGVAICNPIPFTSAELLRVLGDSVVSGKNYRDIERWLEVMTSTTIISKGAVYFSGGKQWASDAFHVFDRAVSVGKAMADGTVAESNYVWLSEWQLQNLNANYLLPIDFEAYKSLRNPIAKALVPLLQIWLFASEGLQAFEKRYDEICQHLNLAQYNFPSKIREKLAPALDELVAHRYLTGWEIIPAAGGGYKLIFHHGAKYFMDKSLRNQQMPVIGPRMRSERPDAFNGYPMSPEADSAPQRALKAISGPKTLPAAPDPPATLQETPLQRSAEDICRYFHQRLYQTGPQAVLIPVELKEAAIMIQQHGIARAKTVIDYFAVEIAPKTHYRPATLCGLRPHVAAALLPRAAASAKLAAPAQPDPLAAQARRREKFQEAYDAFRAQTLARLQPAQPAAYAAFLAHDAARRAEEGRGQNAQIRAITLRRFDRETQCRERAWAYFSERHKEWGLLTFSEWDAEENPHSISKKESM